MPNQVRKNQVRGGVTRGGEGFGVDPLGNLPCLEGRGKRPQLRILGREGSEETKKRNPNRWFDHPQPSLFEKTEKVQRKNPKKGGKEQERKG